MPGDPKAIHDLDLAGPLTGAELIEGEQDGGAVQLTLNAVVAMAVTPDATADLRGKVQLAGDLGGTASAPTVPGLVGKANDAAVVHLTGNEAVAGVKTFSSSPIVPTPTTASQAVPKSYADGLVASGTPDATTSVKGKVQLAGDLGGTAAAPTVPGLATLVADFASQGVHKTGTEIIAGLKTFSSPLTVATPVLGSHAASKGYVDGLFVGVVYTTDARFTTVVQVTKTTHYNLVLSDAGKLIEMNAAAGVTLTVPANSIIPFPVGTVVLWRQYGPGQITIQPFTGVTMVSAGGRTRSASRYSEGSLTKRGTDEWVLSGDLTL